MQNLKQAFLTLFHSLCLICAQMNAEDPILNSSSLYRPSTVSCSTLNHFFPRREPGRHASGEYHANGGLTYSNLYCN